MISNEISTKRINRISDNLFLHYTDESSIESIFKNGLISAIGENSIVIEKSKKIFFSIGTYGALDIMDRWFSRKTTNIIIKLLHYIKINVTLRKKVDIARSSCFYKNIWYNMH